MYRAVPQSVAVPQPLAAGRFRLLSFTWFRYTGRPGRPRRFRTPFKFIADVQLRLL
ncbi:hypothetical protein VA599_23670 [Chromobacterium sp. TRC.1.1.SA]|uniref:Uncharacterized protein n=1 Tax=Chromobacterium indicum TaxID=3110228 RepID=A0ABV0CTP5_9NEIS